jgi:hypothetical protein
MGVCSGLFAEILERRQFCHKGKAPTRDSGGFFFGA